MQTSIFTKSHEFNPSLENLNFLEADFGKKGDGFGTVRFKYYLNALKIQTPKLYTPFGFSQGIPGTASFGRDFNCQFNLDSSTQKIKAFLNGLRQFQDVLVRVAWENRVQWKLFGSRLQCEKATLEDVRKKLSPIVREPRDDRYPPTLKLSFELKYDKETRIPSIKTECHNDKNEDIEPSESTIPRRSNCILQIKAPTVWISPGPDRKFGVKFLIERIKVYQPEEAQGGSAVGSGFSSGVGLPSGECLLDDSDDEE
tara:strand:+ start:6944 stop:7711 length:768 start_codon:yes stop_codon:yes gene_type:complete